MTPDEQLMQAIEAKYGGYIAEAVAGTPFPAALLAALVANESGLNEQAARFEHSVVGDLLLVLVDRKPNFGSITKAKLIDWIPAGFTIGQVALSLANLATSWGPTQIMGYQALAGGFPLSELTNLQKHFGHTVGMLDDFQKRFNIPDAATVMGKDGTSIGEFFHCWNSGRPNGQTADPNYTAKGLARMQLYEALA